MATITSALPSATASTAPANPTAVADQAGVLEGANPTHYSASNPILLFIIQVSLEIGRTEPAVRENHFGGCD